MGPLVPIILSTVLESVMPNGEPQEAPVAPLAPSSTSGVFRMIPDDAPITVMQPPMDGYVQLGKSIFQLSPGSQIRDAGNRIVVPSMVTDKQVVRFKVDPAGQIAKIWILTPEESALPAPKFQ